MTEWPEDRLHLVREGEIWEIHSHERGGRFDVETFDSEDSACVSFLRRMLLLHQAAAGKRPSA